MGFKLAAFADESSNSFLGQVDALKRNNYQFLEIRNLDGKGVTQLTVEEAKEIKKVLDDNGLGICSIGSPIGKIAIDGDFDTHMELYKHTLELANLFGASYMRLFSFFMPKNEEPEVYRDLVMERMSVIARTAKEFGIVACHENEKGIYGDIARRCLEMHKAVPELKAVFDPANFVQSGQDTLEAWDLLHPYVEYMHIKDSMPDGRNVSPGQGAGRVKEIVAKYAGQGGTMLTLEPHLYEFVGLKALEQEDDQSQVGGMAFKTAEEAFDYAVNNLNEILEEIK